MPLFGFATAALLVWIYGPILYKLVRLWFQEAEYAQGMVLCALALYLVWDRRQDVFEPGAVEHPKGWRIGLLMMLAGIGMLVVGRAATEFFSQRLSLVIVCWGVLGYAIGPKALARLWEPAVLTMMAVPLPAVVVDTVTLPLKTLISRLAAEGLSVLGYTVVRYGNVIDLPELRLEVVGACSGIRSFFALLAVVIVLGADMRSAGKRILLVLALFPVVILTNTLRIVSTAMLGIHFPQHGIETYDAYAGWVAFVLAFSLILGLRYWMNTPHEASRSLSDMAQATRNSEDEHPSFHKAPTGPKMPDIETTGFRSFDTRYLGPMICLLIAWMMLAWMDHQRKGAEMRLPTFDIPQTIGEWTSTELTLEPEVASMLAADTTIYRSYRHPDGRSIEVFWIGYGRQQEGKTMHSPRNCLPAAGWDIQHKALAAIAPGIQGRYLLLTYGEYRMETVYWFQAGDEIVWDEFENKWKTLWNSLRHGRSDGSLTSLTVISPIGTPLMKADIIAFASMLPLARQDAERLRPADR